jgi:hypothetical protein
MKGLAYVEEVRPILDTYIPNILQLKFGTIILLDLLKKSSYALKNISLSNVQTLSP